jgi:catechol 2,3-dioxygenase-like lactoylglutathione lyase family enzyme
MLGSAQGVSFLPSRDLERSRTFFEGLGLLVEEMTSFACVLRAGPVVLRVTRVDDYRPQPFTVFGWQVDDIATVVDGLLRSGVAALRYEGLGQDSAGVWTTPDGAQVAWFHDPDGNVLSVTQPA